MMILKTVVLNVGQRCAFAQPTKLDTHLDQWLYFLKHAGELEGMPTVFKNEVIERAFTMAELYAMSDEDRQRYQEELKHYWDALNMLDTEDTKK